ncbi:hypothetical protein O9X98_08945 [Agrobacterium salinitolerans]|nr:hypothetical protein [Agrobacterium salinitolerans]
MAFDVSAALDEVIVLHAGVATTLLEEFPDAFGVWFNIHPLSSSALPRKNGPTGQPREYGNPLFEARATELLNEIAPRMKAIMRDAWSLYIEEKDVSVTAQRERMELPEGTKECVRVLGAFSVGGGAVAVMREMLATADRILADLPTELHVIGMVKDPSLVDSIREAGAKGLQSGMDHLIEQGFILNHGMIDTDPLRKWAASFPAHSDSFEVSYSNPVCRLIANTDPSRVTLYVASGAVGDLAASYENVREYDTIEGFNLEHRAAPAAGRPAGPGF